MRRPKRVIFTADDFGLSQAVNAAVERAHTEGMLRCASLMVAAPATSDAVERARRLPSLRVGLHIVLVNGRPALPPERIPALVDENGAFPSDLFAAGVRYFTRPGAREQLRAEIEAQFRAFAQTGLPLDHVNAQNHFHVHPTVFGIVLEVGRRYGMRAVRLPREPVVASWRGGGGNFRGRLTNALVTGAWLQLMRLRARRAGVVTNDYLFGMTDTGAMTPERVARILRSLPRGVSELYFHPATDNHFDGSAAMSDYAFTDELEALVSAPVHAALRASKAVPTTFTLLAGERAR